MGKAADNEKCKLRATFYNNVAVGCVIAGAAIPYFSFLIQGAETTAALDRALSGQYGFFDYEVRIVVNAVAAVFAALIAAALLRRQANMEASAIED